MFLQNIIRQRACINRLSGNNVHYWRSLFRTSMDAHQITSSRRLASTDATIIGPEDLESIESHKFCVVNVKRYDRENYLAALCIQHRLVKRVVFALRAFNVQLSLVRDSTTDADRAKLRFHFWSKLIEEIVRRNTERNPDKGKEHAYYKQSPVAKELLDLFFLVDVDETLEKLLKDLIGARVSSKVLGYKQFDDMNELELYCSKSNSSLYQLIWRMDSHLNGVLDPDEHLKQHLISVSDNLGVAHGLSNIIRGLPYNATRNCCYVPKNLLSKYNLKDRDFVGKSFDGHKVKPIVRELAERCQELIDKMHHHHSQLPSYHREMFLPRVAIQANLKRLRKRDFNICDPYVGRRNELLPLSLKLATISHRAPIF